MSIRAFSHVAVGVSDMERSLAFYCDGLGLTLSHDGIEDLSDEGKHRTHTRRAAYLRWGDGDHASFIVLDQHERERTPPPRELFEQGLHHFGFWVDDVDAVFKRVAAQGCAVLFAPMDFDSGSFGEPPGKIIRTTIVRDPDGNLVQIDQRGPRR